MIAKANQSQLLQDIQNLFARADEGTVNPFRPRVVRVVGQTPQWNSEWALGVGKAHGRLERRTLQVLELPPPYNDCGLMHARCSSWSGAYSTPKVAKAASKW